MASAAGCISAQWKGAETGSSMARLMPLLLGDLDRQIDRLPWRRKRRPGRRHCHWRPRTTSPMRRSLRRRCASPVRGSSPEQGRHGALADRHGLLHGLAAQAQQARRIGNRQARRRRRAPNIRRANGRRRKRASRSSSTPASRFERAQGGEAHGHQRRLGVGGQGELLREPFEHQGREFLRRAPRRLRRNTAREAAKASSSALPMPTAWEPCPGKMKCDGHCATPASFLLSNRCSPMAPAWRACQGGTAICACRQSPAIPRAFSLDPSRNPVYKARFARSAGG